MGVYGLGWYMVNTVFAHIPEGHKGEKTGVFDTNRCVGV